MLIHITELSPEPLHSQVSRQLRARILSGSLNAGDALPSIRKLSRELRISVITVQTAYETLQTEQLIHSRRSKGFYVSAISANRKNELAIENLKSRVLPLISSAKEEGLTLSEISNILDKLIKEEGI